MKKIVLIIILTIISAFFIFYRFLDIPKYLSFDEVEFAKLSLSLQNKPYIPYSSLATGHSTLYFYILLASLKTFGINTFALRLPSAIFGVLSVLFFYLIVQMSFRAERSVIEKSSKRSLDFARDDIISFLLAIIFLTSHWFLNFARFSFEATFLLFLELVSIYFLIKSSVILGRSKVTTPESLSDSGRAPSSLARMTYLSISGLFAGLAFLSYTPGRIFFLLPLLFLTLKTLRTLKLDKLVYFLIPFIIIITPLTSYLLANKDTRIDQQFFLKNNEMPIQEKITGLWHNISSTVLMFNIKGDVNGRHNYPGKPALNPILGILFIIGLTISIKNWKKPHNLFAISYLLLAIFPALMTYPWENPNMLRTYTVIPTVVYFVGVGILAILERGKVRMTIIIIIILLSSLYELRTYFKYQSTVFKQSFEIKLPLEKAIKIQL